MEPPALKRHPARISEALCVHHISFHIPFIIITILCSSVHSIQCMTACVSCHSLPNSSSSVKKLCLVLHSLSSNNCSTLHSLAYLTRFPSLHQSALYIVLYSPKQMSIFYRKFCINNNPQHNLPFKKCFIHNTTSCPT